jgi:hypothetical protein
MRFLLLKKLVGNEAETDYEKPDDTNRGDAPTCPRCGGYVGMKVWLPPYRVELYRYGRQWGDIAFGGL